MTITGSAAAINTALNGTTFAPTANYSGSTTVTVSTSDGSASDTDSIAINITPVADAPSLTIDVRGSTVSFTSSGETAANSDNTSEVVTTVPLRGLDARQHARQQPWWHQRRRGLDDGRHAAAPERRLQHRGRLDRQWRQLHRTERRVEQRADDRPDAHGLDAGGHGLRAVARLCRPPGFTADYTRIGVYVDGVLVQQYASTSPMTYLDWQNLKFAFVGDGANHVITIQTDATQFNPAGRGAMIDDIRLTGTPGVVANNAASGTLTSVALDTFVSGRWSTATARR